MLTSAYIILKDMPQSPDAITHKGFHLEGSQSPAEC